MKKRAAIVLYGTSKTVAAGEDGPSNAIVAPPISRAGGSIAPILSADEGAE
jgi:hypothetical protein